MPHGKVCYQEILANRAEDSARFYSEIFGWTVRERGDGSLAFDDSGGVSGTWVKQTDRGQNLGAFAAFSDPVGNDFGLYEEPKR